MRRHLGPGDAGSGHDAEKTKALKKDADDKQADADASKAEVQKDEKKVATLQKATAETRVKTTAAAAGEIAREQRQSVEAVANTLGAMQRNYLNDHNVDGLKVICLTDQDPTIRQWCDGFFHFLETEHESQRVRRPATDPSLLQQIFVGVPHKEESKPPNTGK